MLRRLIYSTFFVLFLFLLSPGSTHAQSDWGSITITPVVRDTSCSDPYAGYDDFEVVLENSQIIVKYAKSRNCWAVNNGIPTDIDEFYVKSLGKDIVDGGRFDNIQEQTNILEANVIYDGPDKKTIYMKRNGFAGYDNNIKITETEITMFRDSPVIQIDYLSWYLLFTDWANWPKISSAWASPDQARPYWQNQRFEVYGADNWIRTYDPDDPQARPFSLGYGYPKGPGYIYYSRNDHGDPADGGALSYNGNFITGAYKVNDPQYGSYGHARIAPADRTNVLVMWGYRGWEYFLGGSGRVTTYLYPVTNGAQDIIDTGKEIVDNGPYLNPNQVKSVQFNPSAGTYADQVTVTLSSSTQGAQIYYTLDGSTPDQTSTPYIGPITKTSTTTVKAIAYKSGMDPSFVSTNTYTIVQPIIHTVPGRIEAEDYKMGGEGTAYHDTTAGNSGGGYKSDDVDIQSTSDSSGGYNVGWISTGEWLAYDVDVNQTGNYSIVTRVASQSSGGNFHIEIDGSTVATFNFPATGGWQTWTDVNVTGIPLTQGAHELRIVMDSSDFNLNYLDISLVSSSIQGDINSDGVVNILDYTLLSNAFGTSDPAADINSDGTVNILDYTILSNNFGSSS